MADDVKRASPTTDDKQLGRYLDGEMAPRDARTAEREIAKAPDAQRKLEAMKQIGDVVRARYEAAVDEAAPELDALWAKIAPRLDTPPAVVVPAKGWLAAVREWLETQRTVLATAALAGAAGAVLMLALHKPTVETKIVVVDRGGGPIAPITDIEAAMPATAEVESLEVSGGSGTIFQIPGEREGDVATTVIWVTPDSDEQSGPQGPI